MKVKKPFVKQRNMFGARIKIMWEERLVDPPIDYIQYFAYCGLCTAALQLAVVGRI